MGGFFAALGAIVPVAYAFGGSLAACGAFALYLVLQLGFAFYSRLTEKLADLSTKLDVLFKTADQTLDRASDARHNVRFLPETLDRIESKVNGIEARLERVEHKVVRIGHKLATDIADD